MSVAAKNLSLIGHLPRSCKIGILQIPICCCRRNSSSLPPRTHKPLLSSSLFEFPPKTLINGSSSPHPHQCSSFAVSRPFFTSMVWLDCTVKKEIDVPVSVAYKLYSDCESIPKWMTFISSVEVLKDKPDLSQWSLKYRAFGQNLEYSWIAQLLQPIPNQKIHWRSLEGLRNRGTVWFFPKSPSYCMVELTVSYEVPLLLIPVAPVSTLTFMPAYHWIIS